MLSRLPTTSRNIYLQSMNVTGCQQILFCRHCRTCRSSWIPFTAASCLATSSPRQLKMMLGTHRLERSPLVLNTSHQNIRIFVFTECVQLDSECCCMMLYTPRRYNTGSYLASEVAEGFQAHHRPIDGQLQGPCRHQSGTCPERRCRDTIGYVSQMAGSFFHTCSKLASLYAPMPRGKLNVHGMAQA